MLVLKDVHVRYGSITALRGISLEVNKGEMVGLIGVNGAGKTTTLLTNAGVLKPTGGIISFDGQYIVGKSPEDIVRMGIALVPEGRRIFLLPAWPKNWDVDFRLHAPYQTVVEGMVRGGKLVKLNVTPQSRRKDVTVVGAGRKQATD